MIIIAEWRRRARTLAPRCPRAGRGRGRRGVPPQQTLVSGAAAAASGGVSRGWAAA